MIYTSAALMLLAALASATPLAPAMPVVELTAGVSNKPTATSQMVTSALVQTEADQFLKCVKTTNNAYKVGVDSMGYMLVAPSTARVVDFDGVDLALFNCMMDSTDVLKVAARSTKFGDLNDVNFVSLAEVDYAWLNAQGAQGQKKVASTGVSNASPAANTQYFNFYLNDGKNCDSEDLLHSNLRTCYTRSQVWQSQQIENISGSQTLLCSIWPHHNCEKGDYTTYVISKDSITTCINRQTFSYAGAYKT